MVNKYLIVIAGPTAIGKTQLAVDLATRFDCEILSADSRQFFTELEIGTAKPTAEQLNAVKHYFINSSNITTEYNVGKYEIEVLDLLKNIFAHKNLAIMVGGSGLYINAVCNGFDKLPEANSEIRKRIESIYEQNGLEALQKLLLQTDKEYYNQVDLSNFQRISRALEVCWSTNKKYSELRTGISKQRNFKIIKIGLDIKRELLYKRINLRVDEMIKAGLLDEVKSLTKYQSLNALQTVGYKELFDYLNNKLNLEEAIELIKKNTRNYAKRQLTWFRKDKKIQWFESNQINEIESFIHQQIKL
jgi:tRNA dimethylallyltransferase